MSQASLFRGTGWDERPCLIAWDRDGTEAAYGLPVAGSGYKFGLNPTAPWNADDEERRPDHAEALTLARRVSEQFVGLAPAAAPHGALPVGRRPPTAAS